MIFDRNRYFAILNQKSMNLDSDKNQDCCKFVKSIFFFFFFFVVDTCRVILKHDSLDLIWIRFNWMGLYVTRFHFSMKYHGLNRHVLWAHLFVCLNDNKQMIRFVVFLCFLPRVPFWGRSTWQSLVFTFP